MLKYSVRWNWRTTRTLFIKRAGYWLKCGVVEWDFGLPLEWPFCEEKIVQAWVNMIQMRQRRNGRQEDYERVLYCRDAALQDQNWSDNKRTNPERRDTGPVTHSPTHSKYLKHPVCNTCSLEKKMKEWTSCKKKKPTICTEQIIQRNATPRILTVEASGLRSQCQRWSAFCNPSNHPRILVDHEVRRRHWARRSFRRLLMDVAYSMNHQSGTRPSL